MFSTWTFTITPVTVSLVFQSYLLGFGVLLVWFWGPNDTSSRFRCLVGKVNHSLVGKVNHIPKLQFCEGYLWVPLIPKLPYCHFVFLPSFVNTGRQTVKPRASSGQHLHQVPWPRGKLEYLYEINKYIYIYMYICICI